MGNLKPGQKREGPAFGMGTLVSGSGSTTASAMLDFYAEMSQVEPDVPNHKPICAQSLTPVELELIDVQWPEGHCGGRVSIANTSGEEIEFNVAFTVFSREEVVAQTLAAIARHKGEGL